MSRITERRWFEPRSRRLLIVRLKKWDEEPMQITARFSSTSYEWWYSSVFNLFVILWRTDVSSLWLAVKMWSFSASEKVFWLIVEYHPNRSLIDYLKSRPVDAPTFTVMAYSLASGLAYLHAEIFKDSKLELLWRLTPEFGDTLFGCKWYTASADMVRVSIPLWAPQECVWLFALHLLPAHILLLVNTSICHNELANC